MCTKGGGIFLWREIQNYKFYFEPKTSKLELLNCQAKMKMSQKKVKH